MDLRGVAGLVLALVVVWALIVVLLWVVRPRDARLRDLVRVVPDLLRLVRDLIADRSTPMSIRILLVGLVAYLVNPIDLIPEFIPVLGPLDDVIVAVLVLRHVRRRLGEAELRRRWPGTTEGFELLDSILR
jgi:uncharacterized membrane protein YkvA (DUF1232 family)